MKNTRLISVAALAAWAALAAITVGCVTVSGDAVIQTPRPAGAAPTTAPAPVATSGTQPGPAAQGLCALFTPDEITAYVGSPVDRGLANSSINTCVWSALEGDGYVLLQQVPAEYYEEHTLSAGYHKITGIGEEASIENALLGEGLGITVRSGDSAYFADLVPAADDQAIIALARDFITRTGGQP